MELLTHFVSQHLLCLLGHSDLKLYKKSLTYLGVFIDINLLLLSDKCSMLYVVYFGLSLIRYLGAGN